MKGQQHSGANVILLYIVSTYTAKTEKDFGAKSSSKTAQMAKLWQFLQGHPRPAFSKKVQRGDQGKFFKNRPKSKPRLKGKKHSGANGILLYLVCTSSTKTGKDFGANSGSKSVRMGKLWQLSQGHPKAAFSEKVQRGDQGKFFKNRPKSSPRLNGLRALWRKWHYPPISMHLKCKDWKRFWRKQRL